MKDIYLKIGIKNNYLRKLRLAKNMSLTDVAKEIGINLCSLTNLENFKLSPIKRKNKAWIPIVIKLSEYFSVLPEDIFPVHFQRVKKLNEIGIEFDSKKYIESFLQERVESCLDPSLLFDRKEMSENVKNILSSLSPREEKVIKYRLGMDGMRESSLKEIGKIMYLSSARTRQIEQLALKKLKNPLRKLILERFRDGEL